MKEDGISVDKYNSMMVKLLGEQVKNKDKQEFENKNKKVSNDAEEEPKEASRIVTIKSEDGEDVELPKINGEVIRNLVGYDIYNSMDVKFSKNGQVRAGLFNIKNSVGIKYWLPYIDMERIHRINGKEIKDTNWIDFSAEREIEGGEFDLVDGKETLTVTVNKLVKNNEKGSLIDKVSN